MHRLISLIIPVYNTQAFVDRCVQSVLNQTYSNLQILLVDDGSSDLSGTICDQLAMKDSRITVVHQGNAGVSAARNTGMEMATGVYITFADSDDVLHPRMVERLCSLLLKNEADISSCDYTSDEIDMNLSPDTTTLIFDTVNGISDMLCNKHITYSVYCKLFKQSTVNGVQFHTEYSHNEDLLFCYEAFLKSKWIAHTKEKLYLYYENEESATRVAFSHNRMTAIDVQDYILKDIRDQFSDSTLVETAVQQYLKVNVYTAMQMIASDYQSVNDFKRIQMNIQKRIKDLLTGNLALGYKISGFLISFFPLALRLYFFRRKLTR